MADEDLIQTLTERADTHDGEADELETAAAGKREQAKALRAAAAVLADAQTPTRTPKLDPGLQRAAGRRVRRLVRDTHTPPPPPPAPGEAPSVMQQVLATLGAGARAWTASEILEDAERQGQPITVTDPEKAVFSALSRGNKKGWIERVGRGRYAAPEFAASIAAQADPTLYEDPEDLPITLEDEDD